MIWAKNAPKKHENTKLWNSFYSLRLIFGAWIHISVQNLKNLKNTASEHQKLRKKLRNFSLKTLEIKKKNKKKIGSNDENLRKLVCFLIRKSM